MMALENEKSFFNFTLDFVFLSRLFVCCCGIDIRRDNKMEFGL